MLRRQVQPYHSLAQTRPLLNIPYNQDGEDPRAVCLYCAVCLFLRAVVDGANGIELPDKERRRYIIGFDIHERKSNHRWLGGEFMRRIVSLVAAMPSACTMLRIASLPTHLREHSSIAGAREPIPLRSLYTERWRRSLVRGHSHSKGCGLDGCVSGINSRLLYFQQYAMRSLTIHPSFPMKSLRQEWINLCRDW